MCLSTVRTKLIVDKVGDYVAQALHVRGGHLVGANGRSIIPVEHGHQHFAQGTAGFSRRGNARSLACELQNLWTYGMVAT